MAPVHAARLRTPLLWLVMQIAVWGNSIVAAAATADDVAPPPNVQELDGSDLCEGESVSLLQTKSWVQRRHTDHSRNGHGAEHATPTRSSVGLLDVRTATMGMLFEAQQQTALIYLTHLADERQLNQTQKLASEFGDSVTVTSPTNLSLPNDKPSASLGAGRVPDASLERLNPVAGAESGRVYGHALLSMLDKPNISYLWLLEDDVFFHEAKDVRELIEFFANDTADYIPVSFSSEKQSPEWTNWHYLDKIVPRPWYRSFAPVMRVSRNLVESLIALQQNVGSLNFFEALLPTLAMHRGLTVRVMDSKFGANVRYRPCWSEEEIAAPKKAGLLFHPAKWRDGGLIKCTEH
eukprot:gnl/TRDRNA2_/TRDRNA2_180849_c0_seq1.p1 gnl/TRDRNA2_/TRDRNA2_180849_c0~~gnl/TRDRNA2_/TRDRNA2_180849_c0_seq1.p1  ORF type:complete len:350 (-),score=43.94 gnl/TRDRNA2_/TRDRNA2_180849_c0_seq1:49-1098(-)